MTLNIIYLHSHDTGRYIRPYGYALPTPHLQKLAEQGVLFRQAFCAAPTCSPSRAALLTGQSAHSAGMLGLTHRGFSLRQPKEHLVHTLRQGGYRSALFGVQHVATDAASIGYDEVGSTKGNAQVVAQEAAAWLEKRPAQPFFLDVGFSQTHRDFPEPAPQDDPRYCLPPAVLPDTAQTRRDMAAYHTCVRQLDDGIGVVLAALAKAQLEHNTLVIYTTDHGIAFPGMKCSLTDHGMGVALILRGPGSCGGGKVVDAMVSHLDLYPTLCELAGIAAPAWLQGRSLLPVLRGETPQLHEAVFAEVTFHASFDPQRAVRTQRWKYIRKYGSRRRPVLANIDDSPSKDLLIEHGWPEREEAAEQLYDLVFDPQERANVAQRPEHAAILAELRQRLDQWMAETDDPLLLQEIPLPGPIRVNHPDWLSPRQTPLILQPGQSIEQAAAAAARQPT